MKISLLTTPDEHLDALRSLFTWAESVDIACAWATAGEGRAAHWKCVDLPKVRRAVIGVEFAQTEPWVLRSLLEGNRLRIGRARGTFHPKLYLGVRGEAVRALVGSANLTGAAFSSNAELGVQLEGSRADAQLRRLKALVGELYSEGMEVDAAWIDEYQRAYDRRPNPPIIPRMKTRVESVDDLQISWPRYFRMLKANEGRLDGIGVFLGENSYTRELDNIACVFANYSKFAQVPEAQRRLLMGIRPDSTGLIGSMSAARHAKSLVKKAPERIGQYLDKIPLKGRVSVELVDEVLRGMTALHGVKLGVASRLLTVKRPDLFVSVNNGSNPQLATLLHRRQVTTVPHYLELLKVVWQLDWHQAPPPSDKLERTAWSRRTALLDSILYEEVE